MITVEQLTSNRWEDFVSLMQSDSQCSECWCLNHREPAGCSTGNKAKNQMQELVNAERVNGLLAFSGSECIGWLAIDPMSSLVGHDCFDGSDPNEWSIHCLFVKDGYRGQGVSKKLIESAISFAKELGASKISAFPIPQENRHKFPENEAEFSGRFSTYSGIGFRPVGVSNAFYQRVELEFGVNIGVN